MSTEPQKNIEDKEIDLTVISKGIEKFFQNLNSAIFRAIQFVIKHIIIIGLLFIIGIALGIYLDNNKTYTNQIIVQPNFGSTDYLYSEIDLINAKIKERDTVFIKSIGIDASSKISNIQVKPIIDVYKFITNNNNNDQNFQLLKLMAEDGDINKIVEDNITSKNYSYHVISFETKEKTSLEKTVKPLLNYLDQNNYFIQIQKEHINNTKIKMLSNDVIIAQIDGFLNNISNKINDNSKNDKLVYYNENTQLNDVIINKENLIKEQGYLRTDLIVSDKIIKEISNTLNAENTKSLNGKLKFILPLLFILFYLSIHFFISFYKSQKAKSNN